MMMYIDVVIDNNTDATDNLYTYALDETIQCLNSDEKVPVSELHPGNRLIVPFGLGNKRYEAYIVSISSSVPDIKRIKKPLFLDKNCSLSEECMRTAVWMRQRYICRYIEAIKCFLPVSEVKRKTKDPFADISINPADSLPKILTFEQSSALNYINCAIKQYKYDAFLLKGVTGSGKTEVYLQAMKSVTDAGRQGIVLVPEISLTPQLVSRFLARFGKGSVAVLHSRLTPKQRSSEYKRIENSEVKLVIGARSAVFAPFNNIGLIILDEEHESSYKSDKSPKYDAREVAVKRAVEHRACLVLGSATPSIDDYYRVERNIIKKIELKNRYNSNPLPDVRIVDMSNEIRNGNVSPFSGELTALIRSCLSDGRQAILFLNRRGYSSYISCNDCGYVLKCNECGISVPYHKDSGLCECHYCGRKFFMLKKCPVCGSTHIDRRGTGTQRVEEKAGELFPDAKIERLDLDSIKEKGELEKILSRFEKHETDILIGTQLVAKGLDFSNVGVVGIINADTTLNIPDYRANERSFQLLTQAAGRAGRGNEKGRVIIQTFSPDNSVIKYASEHRFEAFYESEIRQRKMLEYPPFSDIYQLLIMDESEEIAASYSKECAVLLRAELGTGISVIGPSRPMLLRQDGMSRYQILIKAKPSDRKFVSAELRTMKENQNGRTKVFSVDINPYSLI